MAWTVASLNEVVDAEIGALPADMRKTPNRELRLARERARDVK